EMVTLPIEVHVEVAKNRSVGVWIADLEALAGPGSDLQQIIKSLRYIGELRFEQALICDTICRKLALWVVSVNDRQFFRVGSKSADDPKSIDLMQAEDAKRVIMFSIQEPMDIVRGKRGIHSLSWRKGSISSR